MLTLTVYVVTAVLIVLSVLSSFSSCFGLLYVVLCFFFFKQKTAYEMRISDWSSDVCSSDLVLRQPRLPAAVAATSCSRMPPIASSAASIREIGRASCRERVCQYV